MSNKSEKERSEGVARAQAAYSDLLVRKTRLDPDDIEKLFAEGWKFREQFNMPDVWVGPDLRSVTVSEMAFRISQQKAQAKVSEMAERFNVADNLKGIPFSSDDEGKTFPELAKTIVFDQARALGVGQFDDKFTRDEVYVVWFAYILGYWKALCSTSMPDGRYYEVTFNREKSVAYVDTYLKTHNIEVNINQKGINP